MMDLLKSSQYEWKDNLSAEEWDTILSKLNGHPLQSAQWGDSRKSSCGINYYRWVAFKGGIPVFLARLEERYYLKFFKIAWIPKGPVTLDYSDKVIEKEFLHQLKKKQFILCVTNPWRRIEPINNINSYYYTVWIDLTVGKEKLWMNLQKQCRNDIKRAKKLGVVISQSDSLDDLNAFYSICERVSKSKGFSLGNAHNTMHHLLLNQYDCDSVKSHLFLARYEGNICGGAFLMRCGEGVHYLWGAVDRNKYSHFCIGEALQWGIIEWASDNNYKKYDLEGISSKQNSGVDHFKKKLGGTIIAYPNIQVYPLCFGRRFIAILIKIYLFITPTIKMTLSSLKKEHKGVWGV
ncbi:MAG: hypothetical protein A3E83_02540 [Gammaproteobacteria bacterium RIFCSPHIGHO2_12_FULL_41_20]|nr:MAG: hypothetical protein A3E83_02540 [Gammaproteobacteria bacterium RIFCSPHIGHO2_12_FULL_41_20]